MTPEIVIDSVDRSKFPTFDTDAAKRIVEELEAGSSYSQACRAAGVPVREANRWRKFNVEGFGEKVSLAQEFRAELLIEEALDAVNDVTGESANELNAAKLKLSAAQWYAERMKPDRYSPTVINATRGSDGKLAPVMALVLVPPKAQGQLPATHPVSGTDPLTEE